MKKLLVVFVSVMLFGSVFAKATGGKISATLFDGHGNKDVLAEATHAKREPAPAPQQAAPTQPQTTTSTITDGKGKAVRTIEQKGASTTVKDAKGRVVYSTTKNADGSTTVRDGTGRVRTTTTTTGGK